MLFGKTARCALAAASYLAKHYHHGALIGSKQISESINIGQPLVAKVLTIISQAGIITGTRGPNGGYILAKKPSEISVLQISELFGQDKDNDDFCPMGPGWCGVEKPCPLHDTIIQLRDTEINTLGQVTLALFSEQ